MSGQQLMTINMRHYICTWAKLTTLKWLNIYIYTFLMETVRQYGLEISDRQINSAEESQDVNI